MQEFGDSVLWFNRALFMSLGLFVTLAAMLPLGISADAAVMPDLLIAMTFAWIIRRPDTAPLGLVLLLALFADVMLMRPVGLWAMLTLLVAEFARSQTRPLREQMFVLEWLIFSLVFVAAIGLNALILGLTFSPKPGFDLTLNYVINTVAAYPLVVGVMHWVFRVRSPGVAAGPDRLGRVG